MISDEETKKMPDLLVLMGVSGCGKSTLGRILETTKGWRFLEGDDFHSPANKEKMGAGIPLTDEDRWPWYDTMREAVKKAIAENEDENAPVVVACSALKRVYRERLLDGIKQAQILYLHGSRETIWEHVTNRQHEYMKPSLLDSQFEALEEPGADENVIVLEISEGVPAALAKLDAALA